MSDAGPPGSAGDWAGRPLVAVVGMGAVLPGAVGLDAARRLVAGGESTFRLVPEDRWDWRTYYTSESAADRSSCRYGSFLDDPPFPPADFKMPPKVASELHRVDRAVLVAAREALQDSGLDTRAIGQRPGAVVLGFMGYGTSSQHGAVVRLRLSDMMAAARTAAAREDLPPLATQALLADAEATYETAARKTRGRDSVQMYSSVAAARIARFANLHWPHYVIDAACASALAALSVAVRGLQDGRYETVITGGVSPQITPMMFVGLSALGLLGETEVTPFRRSSGTLLGEGAAVFVLQRLEDAMRDGRRIRAVIRGVGSSGPTDGRAPFASSGGGQQRALRKAYERAGLNIGAVQYVEAHANGIFDNDRIELEALNAVCEGTHAELGSIALGSVKDRIGYLQSGAGAAGLLRTILAMEEGAMPTQASDAPADPDMPFERGPFFLSVRPAEWRPVGGLPRRGGVSAFGFGGANYHVVLESFVLDYHRESRNESPRRTLHDRPVAVAGLGAVLPDAPDTDAFWSALVAGRDTSTRSVDTWYTDRLRDWEGRAGVIAHRAARIRGFSFGTTRFRIPPRVASRADPSHLWLLQAAEEALVQAGIPGDVPPRTAVIVAATPSTQRYSEMELRIAYAEFDSALEGAAARAKLTTAQSNAVRRTAERIFKGPLAEVTEDSLVGTMRNVAAGRLAQALGALGPAHVVDAGCASSCAALEIAVRGLVAGDYDLALVGAMSSGATAEYFLNTADFGGNSAEVSRPFDMRADGFIPGEGAVVMVLEREADARSAGRPVRARICGLAATGNGNQSSLYTISIPRLVQAMKAALAESEIDPATVSLIEAHGSCLNAGDTAELLALTSVYGRAKNRRSVRSPIPIACSKRVTGHLMAAAGLAGLVGLVLALEHGVAPPLMDANALPVAPGGSGLVSLPREATRLSRGLRGSKRGGLTSFALGGINYHVVIEVGDPGRSS